MARWYTSSCADCGTEMKICEDWSNPPRVCKSCKDAQWYEKSCGDCGTTIRVHRDWERPPTFCKSCKERQAAKWTEKSCASCGATMRVNRDWDNPPKFCASCKQSYAPKTASCSHCGSSFSIPSKAGIFQNAANSAANSSGTSRSRRFARLRF